MPILSTGKSFSDALILTSTNPQMTNDCSLNHQVHENSKLRTCCVHELFWILKQNKKKQFVYTTCSELGNFMDWTGDSKNNLMSYCGLVYAKIRASDNLLLVKFIYSEKAKKFCKIFPLTFDYSTFSQK